MRTRSDSRGSLVAPAGRPRRGAHGPAAHQWRARAAAIVVALACAGCSDPSPQPAATQTGEQPTPAEGSDPSPQPAATQTGEQPPPAEGSAARRAARGLRHTPGRS